MASRQLHVRLPPRKEELGALYTAEFADLRPLSANEEAERIALWDGREDIGDVEEIDAALRGGVG